MWLVETGGSGAVTLVAEPEALKRETPQLITVRERSAYSVLQSALDFSGTWEFDLFQPTVKQRTNHFNII